MTNQRGLRNSLLSIPDSVQQKQQFARKMLCCCIMVLRKQGDQKSTSWGQKPGPKGCAGSPLASMRHLCSCRRSSASCLSLQHHKSLSHSLPLHSFIHSRHYHTITHSLPAHSHSLTPMKTHFSHYSLTLTNSLSLTHSHSLTHIHSLTLTHSLTFTHSPYMFP